MKSIVRKIGFAAMVLAAFSASAQANTVEVFAYDNVVEKLYVKLYISD